MNLHVSRHIAVGFLLSMMALAAFAQHNPQGSADSQLRPSDNLCSDDHNLKNAQPKDISVEEIIRRFAAKEKEFKEARDHYTYRQSVKMQTLDGNTPTGDYREVFDTLYTDAGKRIENVVFAPQSSLDQGGLSLDPEDLEDIRHRYPFVLTADEIGLYQVLYQGQEHLDELDTFVFDIAPKQIEKNQRYFQGRIWVDQQDLQIVKSCGRPAYLVTKANKDHRYPSFTTYREQIDGQYWFPTYTKSDEVLHFPARKDSMGLDVRLRIIVKYTDYKKFGSKSKIIFGGEAPDPNKKEEPKK